MFIQIIYSFYTLPKIQRWLNNATVLLKIFSFKIFLKLKLKFLVRFKLKPRIYNAKIYCTVEILQRFKVLTRVRVS